MTRKLYQELSGLLQALANCEASHNTEWQRKHKARALELVANHMPSGSGWDRGTTLDFDSSTAEKLVFNGYFHHMNDGGYYDGWTSHTITARPSFLSGGVSLTISGRNRDEVKDDLHERFTIALGDEIES